jgi:small-conductance mechanosensitive channel
MGDWLTPEKWIEIAGNIWAWSRERLISWETGGQVAAIIVSFGIAHFVARRLGAWLERYRNHPTTGPAIRIALPLLMPLFWLVLQWICLAVAGALSWPTGWLDATAGLLFAWIAIRLVSQFVKNAIWANLFVWTAWTIAALNILGWLDPTLVYLRSHFVPGSETITLLKVLQAVLLLVILLSVAVYMTGMLEVRIKTSRMLSPSVQVLFVKSLKIVLVGLAIVIAADQLGFNLTALAVFGGAIGVGVGFGLQRIVSNLISGVILLLDKSIKPGDVIAVAGTYGWVTALGGRYISVVTRDGVEHLIPNETLISERVENWTHTHSRTRLKVDVGVHYRSDVHQAMALCLAAADETERVLKDPMPNCLLIEFGENSVNLQLRFWIADAHNGVQNVKSAVLLGIWDKFKGAGVEIPYPQRDLHLRSGFEALRPGG